MHCLKTLLLHYERYCQELSFRGYTDSREKLTTLAALKKKFNDANQTLETISLEIKTKNSKKKGPSQANKKLTTAQKKMIAETKKIQKKIEEIIISFPNVSHKSDYYQLPNEKNKEIYSDNEQKNNTYCADYLKIIKKFKLLNLKQGSATYGSRNVIYVDKGAQLMRALINYCLAFNIENNYKEITTPTIIKKNDGLKTGKIPKFSDELYFIYEPHNHETEQHFLSPTAELQLMTYYQGAILPVTKKKIYKLTTHSNCFRKEAGASGVNTKGNLRIHEFHKVEIVSLATTEEKKKTFLKMKSEITQLIKNLGLNFRIIQLAKKNLSFSTLATYDFEVYFWGSKKFVEISSLSDCGEFQTRRLKIRYIDQKSKKKVFFNSFNGSALAIDRLFSAIIEQNYQGNKIIIPQVLQKHIPFTEIKITKEGNK